MFVDKTDRRRPPINQSSHKTKSKKSDETDNKDNDNDNDNKSQKSLVRSIRNKHKTILSCFPEHPENTHTHTQTKQNKTNDNKPHMSESTQTLFESCTAQFSDDQDNVAGLLQCISDVSIKPKTTTTTTTTVYEKYCWYYRLQYTVGS